MAKKKTAEDQNLEEGEELDENDASASDGEADENDDGAADDGTPADDENEEVPTRRNVAAILRRKNQTIANLRKKKKPESDDADDGQDDEDVAGRVRKELEPVADQMNRQDVSLQVSAFLAEAENSHFRDLREKAIRYALNPAYARVPIPAIFYQLDYNRQAVRQKKENDDRRETNVRVGAGGNTIRRIPSGDLEKLRTLNFRDKEFQQIRNRIANGETIDLSELDQ